MQGIRTLVILFSLTLTFAGCSNTNQNKKEEPAEWFFLQRSYPDKRFDLNAYETALKSEQAALRSSMSGWSQPWTLEGPSNTGGRINCLAVHPVNQDIILAGSASGGIFKTINGGVNWIPVFDDQPWLAVSEIVYDPQNPQVIYAGTGDKNISITPFIGDGIYKSTDGGSTWSQLGLADQKIIARIVIDPANSNNIYAATMGLPFEKNNDRGVYKSNDGGITWSQSLFVNDSTGAIDLLINPDNPQTLYAATWNRIRNNEQSLVSGDDAGIYKSTDAGATWTLLTNGLPAGNMSRIGLTMSGTNPDHLWAVYVNAGLDLHGIYRSTNGGTSWTQTGDPGPIMGGFGWYFGRIQVNPVNENELWVCGVELWKTSDGGNNWSAVSSNSHVDNHDLVYLSNNTWLLATDGGIYKTTNNALTWDDIDLIPNNQFYRITWNPHISGMYAGGVQDNGTNTGNASAIASWVQIFGADGFQMRYHPTDPLINYVEIQNGGIFATTDGTSYSDVTSGIDFSDRRGWDMPYILNPDNPDELYTGTYRIYANYTGTNANWTPISPDLTDGVIFGERFHTISAIAQSTIDNNFLMAGTSDGNVWKSPDGGMSWNAITHNLPDRFVTSVHYSTQNSNTAYVTHSGYKSNDFIPHIHRTTDNGNTWTDISSNLPQLAINDMVTMPGNDSVLFVATDGGVYGTTDNAVTWNAVGTGMPRVAVFDIEIDENNKLLAGTFGRSMWSFTLDSILTGLSETKESNSMTVYPNPCSDYIYIKFRHKTPVERVTVYTIQGEVARQFNRQDHYSLKQLDPGTYFIDIHAGGKRYTEKIVRL